MNPRETTDKIRKDYTDYITSILSVRDAEITELATEEVKKTEFVKGPYLEATLPFEEGHTLKDLAEKGLISKEFSKMGKDVHYADWKLRIHQEKALEKIISEKRNMVVSTGTGSGKTECYLYPVFNELMREKEIGTLDAGVRALLIFPMNALANDQQKKLRKLLRNYPDITFGRFTGETPLRNEKRETVEQAEIRLHQEYDNSHSMDSEEALRKSIPNEFMCREKMIETPPHILLTNYAMLEYMLLRPDTAPFFDNDSAKNWKFIIIDEAHTYKGATGSEIAFLLRRLKERIRHTMTEPFKCIATSATLGDERGLEDLAKFAQTLFDEPFSKEDIVTTKRQERTAPEGSKYYMPVEYALLKSQTKDMDEFEKGAKLYEALRFDLRLFDLYNVIKSSPKKINDVADRVFSDITNKQERLDALVLLIELAAAARKSEFESALLPARYHLFVKSLEGMFVQYRPQKRVFLDRKEIVREGENSYSVFELANCQKCGQEYIIGKTIISGSSEYLRQTSSCDKPNYYFISGKDQISLETMDEDDSIEESEKMNNLEKYHLCLSCGKITPFAQKHSPDCCDDPSEKKIVTVYNLKYTGKEHEANCCPCCGATKKGLIKRFLTANQPATFAVAKSLYDAVPPRKTKSVIEQEDDIFDFNDIFEDFDESDEKSSAINDESGRKLLIFSDNRQEAAFFAGFLEKKYCLIMWRKAIVQCLKEAERNELCVDDLISSLMRYAEKQGLYSLNIENSSMLSDNQKKEVAAHYVMQEFLNPDVSTGLERLGIIDIFPQRFPIKDNVNFEGMNGTKLQSVFRFMMDTLRQKGAVTYPEIIRPTDDFFEPKNHSGYFRQQGSESSADGYIYGFVPDGFSVNKRLSLIVKMEKKAGKDDETADKDARRKLSDIYAFILKLEHAGYIRKTKATYQSGAVYCIEYSKWIFRLIKSDEKLYRCKKCGKVFSYSVDNLCPELKCDGTLEEVEASEVQNKAYYSGLYSDTKIVPMIAKEHTAQLSSDTAGKYQKDFEEGKINVLSCSTTFEMGVDVGELEATFQRNVPPETSNYIQRAGRAGRRTSSAAFSVTFSRRSSHDMTFFQNPPQIIAGKIAAPILEVKNDKIARRHLNSIVISWFFKQRPEFFKEKSKAIVDYDMAKVLKDLLEMHPEELLKSIHSALPEEVCDKLKVDEWSFIDDLTGKDGSLSKAIIERKADLDGLNTFLSEAKDNNKIAKQIAASKLINTLESEASLNFLSAKGVLPKYGFPIDTVSLDVISGEKEEAKKIDLSRDLKMAISEFAPPAKIVANSKVWTSYAINSVPNKSWPTYVYYECPKCGRIHPPKSSMTDITYDLSEAPSSMCNNCNTKMNAKKFIVPIFGFSTKLNDNPKSVGESRPSTYYATQTQFWGIEDLTERQKAEAKDKEVLFKGQKIGLVYSPGGKLFVLNQGTNGRGLNVCSTCGYTEDPSKTKKKKKHETKYGGKCSGFMVNTSLGHTFSTDIVKIEFPRHPYISNTLKYSGKDPTLSVLYAILEGASAALQISRDDINGCVDSKGNLILFDDTPGGAGLVKRIFNNINDVLRTSLNKMSGKCGCADETSCYGCLRTYSNQFFHDKLSRGLAKEYLEWLLYSDKSAETENKNDIDNDDMSNEDIGARRLDVNIDTHTMDDSVTALKELLSFVDDAEEKIGIENLIEYAEKENYEHPIINDKIQADEEIWPEIFWPQSHVVVFAPGDESQFNKLKKYDWYCYIFDRTIDAKRVFSHIKKAGD